MSAGGKFSSVIQRLRESGRDCAPEHSSHEVAGKPKPDMNKAKRAFWSSESLFSTGTCPNSTERPKSNGHFEAAGSAKAD